MRTINFSLPECYDCVINRRKRCAIHNGDNTAKYIEGEIVSITLGKTYTERINLYTAFIDQVLVKPISLLTSRDINGENCNLHTVDEFMEWYSSVSKTIMNPFDLVTIIYFSEIIKPP